jgi:hypothetical protein
LPVTGVNTELLTTIGIAFILGGAGVLYLTKFTGEPEDRTERIAPGRVPSPRRSRSGGESAPAATVRRRRPSPMPQGRHAR